MERKTDREIYMERLIERKRMRERGGDKEEDSKTLMGS